MPPRSLPGILAAVLSMARPAIPDIDGARPVSPEGAIATRTALAVDVLDNAYLAAVLDGKVKAITLGSTFSSEILLSDIRIPQEDPAIEVSPPATAHVVFAQEDNELGAWGREIFYSSNPGGDFAPVLNASGNKIDDRSPDLAIDPDGIPRFVWVRDDGTGGRIVHQKDPRGSPQEIARGEFPSVTVDRGGFSHVVFLRDGAVRAVSQGAEGFGEEKELDRIPGGASSAPRIGVDRLGRLAVAYEADGELRLVLGSAGAFDPPRVLDRDLDPGEPVDAFLRNDGRLSVAYLKEGDLIVIRGSLEEALEPARITRTPQRESSPAAREDLRGNLHISFIRDGRIY